MTVSVDRASLGQFRCVTPLCLALTCLAVRAGTAQDLPPACDADLLRRAAANNPYRPAPPSQAWYCEGFFGQSRSVEGTPLVLIGLALASRSPVTSGGDGGSAITWPSVSAVPADYVQFQTAVDTAHRLRGWDWAIRSGLPPKSDWPAAGRR